MKKIGLTGYYGMSNYGDDLFGILSVLGAREYWPEYELSLLCPALEEIDVKYIYPHTLPAELFRCHNRTGAVVRLGTYAAGILYSDSIVYSGGSLFRSGRIGVKDLVHKILGRKIKFYAIGVSVGPYDKTEDEKAVIEKLKAFDFISTRDKVSYDRLLSYDLGINISESADLAGVALRLMSPVVTPKKSEEGRLRLGFSPCFLKEAPTKAKKYCDIFISTILELSVEISIDVTVLCLNQHPEVGDFDLSQYVQSELLRLGVRTKLVLYQEFGVRGTWNLISNFDAYVSVRLHGAISSYLCGVPFLLFEYQEKCTEFLDYIGKHENERIRDSDLKSTDYIENFKDIIFGRHSNVLCAHSYFEKSKRNFIDCPLARGE